MKHIKESIVSIAPIAAIILILHFSTLVPMPAGMLVSFLIGAVLLILGMSLFSLGVNLSIVEMGSLVGSSMLKSKRVLTILVISFILGVIVTVAEPDLTVLAEQVPSIPSLVLILTVAVGVGIFLLIAVSRILLKIPLKFVLLASYALVFLLAIFVGKNSLSIAFDSGGVTTGPITVPFILAIGIGLSSFRASKNSDSDSFGYIALCSVGPILAVLCLGLIFPASAQGAESVAIPGNFPAVLSLFFATLAKYLKTIAIAILPILLFFLLYQSVKLKLPARKLAKMCIGLVYTYFGLVLFLTGASMGFIMTGSFIGASVASSATPWLLLPIGLLVGLCIVLAEPAVHVLVKQVEAQTGGTIKKNVLLAFLAISVSISVGLAVIRMLTGISILWILVPFYILALSLMFFVPDMFTGIAFDSGGVASGAMTSTFLLPLALGAVEASGGNIMSDAFGVVAMVAMAPLVTIQLLGLIYKQKSKRFPAKVLGQTADPYEIIEF